MKKFYLIFSLCLLTVFLLAGCGSTMTAAAAETTHTGNTAAEASEQASSADSPAPADSPVPTAAPSPTPIPTATPSPTPTPLPMYALGGHSFRADCTELDLSQLTHAEVQKAITVLASLYDLETVYLGELGDAEVHINSASDKAEAQESSDETAGNAGGTFNPDLLLWEDIAALQQAAPGAVFHGTFTLYGIQVSLTDCELNLNHITIQDDGVLVRQVISCMPMLNYLDMDTCGIDDEHMASLRDDFPAVKVVWRIWFGDNYSCRTDTEKILASAAGLGGWLTVSNTQSLKYCTDIKYLDLGHNEYLHDISYVAYMPHLQVAILAMLGTADISPLANCPEMEFLEIQTNCITDLSPLSNMKELKHLNIAHNFDLTDITPLYGLTQLERLWIGSLDPVPAEQVEEMQRCAPQCDINTEAYDPHDGWRYGVERYALLVKQFGYNLEDYTVPWKEPKSKDSSFRADETGNPVLTQYRFDETVNQILLVTYEGESKGKAEFFTRCGSASWVKLFESDAVLGKNGVGKTEEGDGKTPLGDFGVRCAFGAESVIYSTELDYIPLTSTIYCCNEDCEYYNQIIDTKETGHNCTGEAMSRIMPEYYYGLSIDYNSENEYPLGSAIFVHCLGTKDTTSGCIAIPQNYVLTILQKADAGMRVVIVDGTADTE